MVEPKSARSLTTPSSPWDDMDLIKYEDFSDVGEWTTTGGTWAVESNQYSCDTNGSAYLVTVQADFQASVDVTIVSGRFAGIIFHYTNDEAYLYCYVDESSNQVRLAKSVNGAITNFAATAWPGGIGINVEYHLTLSVLYKKYTVRINDTIATFMPNPDDSGFLTGKFGVKSGYGVAGFNTHAHFDNFTVYQIPRAKLISTVGETLIRMDNGTSFGEPIHGRLDYMADGLLTRGWYQGSCFMHMFNYTIIITQEAYYNFTIWTGDLGGDQSSTILMLRLNDTILSADQWDSVGSGSTLTYAGNDQNISMGQTRLLSGYYNLQLVNLINTTTVASENYAGIKITMSLEPVRPKIQSFIVLSDTHYDDDGLPFGNQPGAGGQNLLVEKSKVTLQRFVSQVNAMNPLPEFVVITGDIDGYDPIDYALVKVVLDTLSIPYYLVIGNHDDPWRADLITAFGSDYPEWTISRGWYYRDIGGVRLVMLDCDEGAGADNIGSDQQAWLNSTLETDQSVFVFLHYPLQTMVFSLTQKEIIKDELEKNGNVVASFSGHAHRQYLVEENGILYVGVGSLIEWPMAYTVVDVSGTAIDVSRTVVNDTATLVESVASGESSYLQVMVSLGNATYLNSLGFGDWTPGWYLAVTRQWDATGVTEEYDRPVYGHSYIGDATIINVTTTGQVNLTLSLWSSDSKSWIANGTGNATFTLSGLESGRMYRLYVDGVASSLLTATGGTISFTYSGPWSEHQFEIVATSITGSISPLVNLIFIMFGIGIVVGVIAEGTNSLRNQKMRTTEQMVKSLLNMVVYIIIGMASLGVLYSIVA